MPLARDLTQIGAFFQHALGLSHHAQPYGRNTYFGAAPLEQHHTQLVLELAYGDGQSRLADETGFGGASEMPFTGNRYDVLQFGQSHYISRKKNIVHRASCAGNPVYSASSAVDGPGRDRAAAQDIRAPPPGPD